MILFGRCEIPMWSGGGCLGCYLTFVRNSMTQIINNWLIHYFAISYVCVCTHTCENILWSNSSFILSSFLSHQISFSSHFFQNRWLLSQCLCVCIWDLLHWIWVTYKSMGHLLEWKSMYQWFHHWVNWQERKKRVLKRWLSGLSTCSGSMVPWVWIFRTHLRSGLLVAISHCSYGR